MNNKITSDQVMAAYKLLKTYNEQQAEQRRLKFIREREAVEARCVNFNDVPSAVEWAERAWEQDKTRGIGTGMTRHQAIAWYLDRLSRSWQDVCQAFFKDAD